MKKPISTLAVACLSVALLTACGSENVAATTTSASTSAKASGSASSSATNSATSSASNSATAAGAASDAAAPASSDAAAGAGASQASSQGAAQGSSQATVGDLHVLYKQGMRSVKSMQCESDGGGGEKTVEKVTNFNVDNPAESVTETTASGVTVVVAGNFTYVKETPDGPWTKQGGAQSQQTSVPDYLDKVKFTAAKQGDLTVYTASPESLKGAAVAVPDSLAMTLDAQNRMVKLDVKVAGSQQTVTCGSFNAIPEIQIPTV